jgi:imidazolonepropionase-like amidohydrolase
MYARTKLLHSRRLTVPLAFAVALANCVPYVPAVALNRPCSVAISHVNVIPMDSDRILRNQTVQVGGGKILSIAPSAGRQFPACAQVVDGAHRYLVPGLNDMHTHIETVAFAQALGVKPEPIDFPSVLALYIAYGVTGLRIMSGAPDILAFRNSQGAASSYPRLIVGSPMLSGDPPVLPEPLTKILRVPEEARAVVRGYAHDGYDFIKVRDNLAAPVFRAVIEEARRDGLYVDGHISQHQGLSVFDVLDSGQHAFAHLDDLALQMTDKAHDPDRFISQLRKCSCFIESTIGIERNTLAQLEHYDAMVARPQMRFMNPLVANAFWLKPNNPYLREKPPLDFLRSLYADSKMLLKKFTDAGIHVVAGSDSLNPMLIPGLALHDEFDSMIEAGLSPYQVLKTATANAAAYVPGFKDIGVLAVGRTANAVMVKLNPLEDISRLRDPDAVMINGNWRDRDQIQRLLDAAVTRYHAQ